LLAVDGVVEANGLGGATGDAEAEGEGLSGGGAAVAFGAGKLTHAGVEEPGLVGTDFSVSLLWPAVVWAGVKSR